MIIPTDSQANGSKHYDAVDKKWSEAKEMARNEQKVMKDLTSLPQDVLVKKFVKVIRKYRTREEELEDQLARRESEYEDELASRDAAIDKRDAMIAALKTKRRREDEQAQRELAKAKRAVAEAKQRSAELIASAQQKVEAADARAKTRIADAKRESEAIRRTSMRSVNSDIKHLETVRENEKRRTITAYDGMINHCDDLIASMTKMLEDIRKVRDGLNNKKKEVRAEEFKTFNVHDYIDDTDDADDYSGYLDQLDFSDSDDMDIMSEILDAPKPSTKRQQVRGKTQGSRTSANAIPPQTKAKSSSTQPTRKKKQESVKSTYDADLDFADFDDDDDDDLIDFTGSFIAVKPGFTGFDDDDEDFDLDMLDDFADDDYAAPPKSSTKSAASRWLS